MLKKIFVLLVLAIVAIVVAGLTKTRLRKRGQGVRPIRLAQSDSSTPTNTERASR